MRTYLLVMSLLVTPSLMVAAPVPKAAEKHPWVGKYAFPKTPLTKLYTEIAEGKTISNARASVEFLRITKVTEQRVEVVRDSARVAGSVPQNLQYYNREDVLIPSDAIEFFTTQLKNSPEDQFALSSRGWAQHLEGKRKEADADYTKLLELSANNTSYRHRRSLIRLAMKNFEGALEDCDALIALSPSWEPYRQNRCSALVGLKRFEEAIAEYTKMLETTQSRTSVLVSRGLAYDRAGQHQKALDDYDAVIADDAKSAVGWNNKAWLRSTCPEDKMRNGKEAVEFATKACELTNWANAGYLDTLAAAYAEVGEFDKAVKWQKEAARDKSFQNEEGIEVKARLELYQQKKPYRQAVEKK